MPTGLAIPESPGSRAESLGRRRPYRLAAERISDHQAMKRGSLLRCEAIAWVDVEWPGWIRVRLEDADGRSWYLVDKVPVFGLDIGPEARMPMPLHLLCDVVSEDGDHLVVVPRWRIQAEDGTSQFRVRRDQLTAAGA
ncbi:hypothetical protein [Krasilnikovia sp. MM14-A1259]|uniref:hypothetical protein n=1 Tax=Krasilnikovia sp. MM14-A1259 TaxID=3373539 RepID=UPI00399CA74E